MKSDGEKGILNIVEAVEMMRGKRDKDRIVKQSPHKGKPARMRELNKATMKSKE